jgi:hypothetical protein
VSPVTTILIVLVTGANLWLLFAEPSYWTFLAFMILVVVALGRFRMLWILAFIIGFITGLT